MADPWHHAVSSARKWGGDPESYIHLHLWFDETKGWCPDFRHRAIRHHSEGIAQIVDLFDPIHILVSKHDVATVPRYRVIPIRWVAERHVIEDCGMIPTAADWLRTLQRPEPWMVNPRKLSKEQETENVR